MRPAEPAEQRVLQALLNAGVIDEDQHNDTLAELEATTPCHECGGTGVIATEETEDGEEQTFYCYHCATTGAMRTLEPNYEPQTGTPDPPELGTLS